MPSRRLGFESLESRRVCAGNVVAKVVAGELQITATDTSTLAANHNFVEIQQVNVGGQIKFVVTGKAFAGSFNAAGDPIASGAVTKINGGTTPFRAAASKISVNLGKGNDAVVIGGKGLQLNLQGLQVVTGTGSDYARLSKFRLDASTTSMIDMTGTGGFSDTAQAEVGKDKVVVNELTLAGGSLAIPTGGGNDRVALSNINVPNTTSYLFVYAGNGVDTVNISSSTLQKVSAFMGGSVEKDTVTVQGTTTKEMTVELGPGNDLLHLVSNVTVKEASHFDGDDGTDTLKVGTNVKLLGVRDIDRIENRPPG